MTSNEGAGPKVLLEVFSLKWTVYQDLRPLLRNDLNHLRRSSSSVAKHVSESAFCEEKGPHRCTVNDDCVKKD